MLTQHLLWTDALIYLLLGPVVGFVAFAHRREHLWAPWRKVAHSPLGMGALVVLLAYVLIGVLDSVHFGATLQGSTTGGETVGLRR